MSNITKIILLVISGILLYSAYWYYFSFEGQLWRVNQEIERSWREKGIFRNEAKKEVEDFNKTVFSENDTLNQTKTLTSSSRDPIILEGKRNYVTGKNISFLVPETMRRLRLTIQDRLGRKLSSYTLPNTFINIKPKQRINLEVIE